MVFEKLWYYQKPKDFMVVIMALLYGHIINITFIFLFFEKINITFIIHKLQHVM